MNQKAKFQLFQRLQALGFSYDEAQKLRRIEMTLQRWAEDVCNGDIQRDGENGDGRPRRYWADSPATFAPAHRSDARRKSYPIADREAGALRRLAGIMRGHPELVSYHQSDPRGCMLYILRKSDILDGETIDSIYTRGLAVA